MPKSTKKQKEKSADFKKTKLKLGKGKKPATNAVDTSFKTQSIALPVQSITIEKSNIGPSTRKKQTLSELLSLLRHYSPGSRKDALAGLRELFSSHPDLSVTSISSVLPVCCRLISDEDASVRKVLLEFLDWYLHILPKDAILPHAATLMLFTTSAQTHIFPEIRVDAVKIVDVLLEVVPEIVTSRGPSGHGQRVFQGYLSLLVGGSLNQGSDITHTSAIILSVQSRLTVLSSLATFLEHASQVNDQGREPWYLRASFSSDQAYLSFAASISRHHRSKMTPHEISDRKSSPNERQDGNDGFGLPLTTSVSLLPDTWLDTDLEDALEITLDQGTAVKGLNDRQDYLESAEQLLHPVLVSGFLDNASTAFIGSQEKQQDLTALRFIHSVVRITASLYVSASQETSESNTPKGSSERLQSLLMHFSTYFPFDNGAQSVTSSEEALKHDINIVYSRLSCLPFLRELRSSSHSTLDTSQKPKQKAESPDSANLLQFVQWVEGIIGAKSSQVPMARPLSEGATDSLLPMIWVLLTHHFPVKGGAESTQIKILRAITDSLKQPGLHGTKIVFIRFLAMLTLLEKEPKYIGNFRLREIVPAGAVIVSASGNSQTKLALIEEFLAYLPKILWEIGTKDISLTEFILIYLLRAVQRRTLEFNPSIASQISQRLTPFFLVQHPTRGVIFGPYRQLQNSEGGSAVQRLALDLVFSLYHFRSPERSGRRLAPDTTSSNSASTDLIRAVSSTVLGTTQETYWARLISL